MLEFLCYNQIVNSTVEKLKLQGEKAMRLNISENIKRLRKEKGVTQEDLAEAFNVSCQSISRWETDASYPDIELLPIIANYFDVTTDELLGTDKISLEYKRNEYKKQIETLLNDGEPEKALQLCKKAEKEHPQR